MKAVLSREYGGVEVLEVTEVPRPELGPGHVLVRVHASPVNSGDVRIRALDAPGLMKPVMRMIMGWSRPRQPILGTVYAGVVEAVAEGVQRFTPGDRVFGTTGFSSGCHAEYVVVKESSSITPMPEGASFAEAAALPFGGQTALHFLDKVDSLEGKKAMVYGASGAVGTMAVQILKAGGATVTAVSSAANFELTQGLGADRVLDYSSEEFSADTERYDIIFDTVGHFPKAKSKPRLAEGGSSLTVGSAEVAKETADQLQRLKAWFEQGAVRAVIEREFAAEEAAQAHRLVDSKRKKGSVILLF